MSYTSGLILSPVGSYPSTDDIQKALGVSSGDLGTLCQHANINIFSKYKPTAITGYDQPSDATLLSNGYGVHAVATTSRATLYSRSLAWSYDRAAAPYFRQLDFNRYYNGAPVPFMQANGTSITVDLVNESTAPALFYMMMRTGYVANKPFSTESGIGTSGTAVPSGYPQYCLCVEDLGFDSGGGSFVSIMGGVLGLVIFNTSGTYQTEVFASSSHTIRAASSRDNDMFIIPLSGLSLAMGTYTAVACAKVTDSLTYYCPVYNHANYPARFPFYVGGLDLYSQTAYGVSASSAASSSTIITTNATSVYVTMRFYNNSGRTLKIKHGSNQKFTLKCDLSGSVEIQGSGTQEIDRTYSTATPFYPGSSDTDIEVADGSYGTLIYEIPNIWSPDGGSSSTQLDSGSVALTPRLYYNGTTEYTANSHRALSVTYGQ